MANQNLDIIIVGGSLAGLMHGIVLKRLGHNVRILNRDPTSFLESQGAGITAFEKVQDFFSKHDFSKQPYSIHSPHVQFLNREAKVIKIWKIPMQMTSWSFLYHRLRANFDGLTSAFCPDPPKEAVEEGKALYDYGKKVTAVSNDEDGPVSVDFDDVTSGERSTLHVDLVIAADGSGSTIRQILQPGLRREYVGYIAWRGCVQEQDVSMETRKVFGEKFTVFHMNQSYIIVYIIPGENGSLKPGERVLNLAWYCNYPHDSLDLENIMTDTEGHRHHIHLPMGKMRDEIWAQQRSYAAKVLPVPYLELLEKTKHPSAQSITEVVSPRASFFDGKLLLVGDALATFRPHAGASTNQAALSALLLEKVMKNEITLHEWERSVLQYAQLTNLLSTMLGNKFQFGFWEYFASAVRYGIAWAVQWLQKHWYG